MNIFIITTTATIVVKEFVGLAQTPHECTHRHTCTHTCTGVGGDSCWLSWECTENPGIEASWGLPAFPHFLINHFH